MTNQNNQNKNTRDELEQRLLNDSVFQHILKFAPESQRELMTFELARYFNNYLTQTKQEIIQACIDALPSSNCARHWADDKGKDCTCDLISKDTAHTALTAILKKKKGK